MRTLSSFINLINEPFVNPLDLQTIQETGRNGCLGKTSWPFDGQAELLPAQTRDQVAALVHRFGQPIEQIAVTQEIGAHGQYGINGEVDSGFEPQHQINKIIGLGTAMGPLAARASCRLTMLVSLGAFSRA
jgi:hypothetical protein